MKRGEVRLVAIGRDGVPVDFAGELPPVAREACAGTANLYESVGFVEPWIGYLAVRDGEAVGTCAFKAPPSGGAVEIAYFTFPEHEGRGIATAMARELVALAARDASSPRVTAQTLPERNASHRILEKLGFSHTATPEHPEDGTVFEWQLGDGPPA